MQMRNGQTRSFRTVFLAGFLLVSVLIYFRPNILGALGYADVGMPRTIFIVASIIAMLVVALVARIVSRSRSNATGH
jgi:hypothetical protein